ncbi:MAG: flotillin-like protein FloA [Planctomycetota bacterium]
MTSVLALTLLAEAPVIQWVLLGVLGIVLLLLGVAVIAYFGLWLQAYLAGARISLFQIIAMRLRKVNPGVIVRCRIMGVQADIPLDTKPLEAHYLAGGNVMNVVRALIAADRADLGLEFRVATGIDLAGRNVLEAVQTCVNPKVIDCPDPRKGRDTLDAVAKDGIQLRAKARVTVKTHLARLIGGATEETIIARVGEGVVSAIGSSASHKKVLENPDVISKAVLGKGLDSGSAFEIVSIDIADVDVGENIGARLQADQAEADKRVAQAKAEERRAMAVALEQEMTAQIQENRAKVVLAEAEIPKAISQAFREGNLGIMDYYRLKNIQADTQMRSSVAEDVAESEDLPGPGA